MAVYQFDLTGMEPLEDGTYFIKIGADALASCRVAPRGGIKRNKDEITTSGLRSAYSGRLMALMRERGLSNRMTAAALGVTEKTIENHLAMKYTPDTEVVAEAAWFFDVSMDWLCGLTDERGNL